MRGWGFVPHFYMYDIKKTESGNFVYTENKPILFFNEKFIKIHKHNIVIYEYDKPMLADMIKLYHMQFVMCMIRIMMKLKIE